MVLFTSIHASINTIIDTVISPTSRFLNLLAAFFKWVAFNSRPMSWAASIGAAVTQRWTTLPPPPTPASMYLPPGSLNGTATTGGASYLVVAVKGNERVLWDIGWIVWQAVDLWIRSHIYTSIVIVIVVGGVLGAIIAHFLKRTERQPKEVRRYADTGRALPAPSPWTPAIICVEDAPSPSPFDVATLPSPPVVPESSHSTSESSVELDLDAIDFSKINPEDFGGRSDVDESDSEVEEKDNYVAGWQSEDEREDDEWAAYGRFATERMSLKIALKQSVLEDEDGDEDEEYFDALSEQPGQQVGCSEAMPAYVDEYMEWSLGPFVPERASPEMASEDSVVEAAAGDNSDVADKDYSDAMSDLVEARSDTPELVSSHLDGDSPFVFSPERESSSHSLDFIQEQLQEDDSASPCPPSPAFYSSPPSSIPELVVNPPTPPLGSANGYTVWAYHSSPEYLNSVPEEQDRSILSPDDAYDIIGDEEGDEEEYYVEDDGDEEWEDVSDSEGEVYDDVYEDEGEYEEEGQGQDTSVTDHLEHLDSLESSFELSDEAAEGLEDWINEEEVEEGYQTDAYADAQAAFTHLQSLGTVEAYSPDLMERFDPEDVEGLEEWIGEESVYYDKEEDEKEGEPWVEWWYGGEPEQSADEEEEFENENEIDPGDEDDGMEEEDTIRLSPGEVDDLEGYVNGDGGDDDG